MTSNYVTMVFRMPDDERQRKQVIDAIGIGKDFHGAQCIAMGVGDEMTLNELLVEEVGEGRADQLRAEVDKLLKRRELATAG